MPIRAAVLAAAALVPLPAQTWQQRASAIEPAPRWNHAMAPIGNGWHALFGGQDSVAPALGDTWIWDGGQWLQPGPVNSPPPRRAAQMAQCAQGVLLFGGEIFGALLSDTWLFDGATWQAQSPATVPAGRTHHGLAYDPARDRVVMFGGLIGAQTPTDETWEWDGSDWQAVGANPKPSARQSPMLAFDPIRQRTLLFGGFDIVDLNDTWEWNGQTWQQHFPNSSPFPRRGGGMVFHVDLQRIVLFGGYLNGFGVFDQTREWDGSNWYPLQPPGRPLPRAFAPLIYDGRDATVFGGYSGGDAIGDTWSYGPAGTAGTVTFYGQGCGAPSLQLANPTGNRLAIGRTFGAELRNLPATASLAFVAFGLSDTQFGGGPLPLDLAPFGLPGCWLWQDNAITTAYPTTLAGPGRATFSVALPGNQSLLGFTAFAQGWTAANGVNPAGVLTSDGFRLTVGN